MLRRGYLYWVSLDKRRPALLLSPDVRNDEARDVIVIPAGVPHWFKSVHGSIDYLVVKSIKP